MHSLSLNAPSPLSSYLSLGEQRPGFDHTTFDEIGHYAYVSTQHRQGHSQVLGFFFDFDFVVCLRLYLRFCLHLRLWLRLRQIKETLRMSFQAWQPEFCSFSEKFYFSFFVFDFVIVLGLVIRLTTWSTKGILHQVAVLNSPDMDPTEGDDDCKIRSCPTHAQHKIQPCFFLHTFEWNISLGTITTSMVVELVPFP